MRLAICTRLAAPADEPFLFALYADTRAAELDAWGWPEAVREPFLRMQFEARRQSYRAAFPDAVSEILLEGETPIGRLLTARSPDHLHLVDIALVGARRGRGIGAVVLSRLLEECESKGLALSLHVAAGNPAERLYRRLGLGVVERDPMYLRMESAPGGGAR